MATDHDDSMLSHPHGDVTAPTESASAVELTPIAQSDDGSASLLQKSLHTLLIKEIHDLKAALEVVKAKVKLLEIALALKKDKVKETSQPFYEEPFAISFPDDEEVYRRSANLRHGKLPKFFFRTHYASSGTISSYMSRDCWPSVHPNLKEGVVFQSLEPFLPARNLSLQSVLRHFVWKQKHPFTAYVSVFDNYTYAKWRASFLYHDSMRKERRISVAKISTAGLVPAFFEATSVTPEDLDKIRSEESSLEKSNNDPIRSKIRLPIWVDATAVPGDRSNITLLQLENSGADVWLSVHENTRTGLHIPTTCKGQPEEWLCGGAIPKSRIVYVRPYDGNRVHAHKGQKVVTSSSNLDLEWDWEPRIWRSRAEMNAIKETLEREAKHAKRCAIFEAEQLDNPEDANDAKRQKLCTPPGDT